jgi:serine/threonine protein kinase
VAVKKIRRPEEEDSESFYAFLQELKSEASIMAYAPRFLLFTRLGLCTVIKLNDHRKMNHPNLVYLYGVCMPPDLSLVMEFVEHGKRPHDCCCYSPC